jgi:basic membrane lipoprotein Med (substrate-binding protein (PBP1-ABC) superfamily)
MKENKLFPISFLIILTALLLISCARKMTDKEYYELSEEFTEEFVQVLLDPQTYDQDIDVEDLAFIVLEEVTQDKGYNAKIYLAKAEELDEDWDDIWERIDVRLEEQFRKIMEHADEDEAEYFDSRIE